MNKYFFVAITAILLSVGSPSIAQVAYSRKAEQAARRDERKQNKQYRRKHKKAEHRKDKKAMKKELKSETKDDKHRQQRVWESIDK